MKVGLVGFGKMGILHTSILNTIDSVEIASIAEKEGMLTKNLKKIMPKINVYQDYEKMLKNENLDLVFITTPVVSHLPMTLECIKNNVNFFVEKPLTRNLEEAKKICDKLKKTQLINAVGYNLRFVETFAEVKSLLNQNILGRISDVKATMYASNVFSKPSGWRFKKKISGGGVLLELGCHLIDLLQWYFGKVVTLTGKIKSVYSEVEDFANADLDFNGFSGKIDTTWSKIGYSIPEVNIEIKGVNGKLRVNQDFIDIKLEKSVASIDKTEKKIYKQELNQGVHFDVAGADYTREDLDIIHSVNKKKSALISVFEASKTQSIIQAIYDSAEKQSKVEVQYVD